MGWSVFYNRGWVLWAVLLTMAPLGLVRAEEGGVKTEDRSTAHQETAIFAGGCFWCMQPPFEKLDGVKTVLAGYTGGAGQHPTYEDYAEQGHLEAVEITYDPALITYAKLLNVFWRQIDPTDSGGQFCDRGPQYRSAIFYLNETQQQLAEHSKDALGTSGRYGKPLVTEIVHASVFYRAEAYHQEYHKKNPIRYNLYRFHCGRDRYLDKVWADHRIREEN